MEKLNWFEKLIMLFVRILAAICGVEWKEYKEKELTEDEQKEKDYKKELLNRVEEANLYYRAERLKNIVNYCIQKKIKLPNSQQYGYKYGFTFTDVKSEDYHVHFALYDCDYNQYSWCFGVMVGRRNVYDCDKKPCGLVITNTTLTSTGIKEVQSWQIETLLNEFNSFEKAFLDWCKRSRIQCDGELNDMQKSEYEKYKRERIEENG